MKKFKKIKKYADIITDIQALKIPTIPVKTIKEGEEIAAKLFKILNKTKTGIGLTANQIGINKSVFVVNVKEPLYFINPKIIEYGKDAIIYKESCLSLPGKFVTTKRTNYIKISADNLSEPKEFKADKTSYTSYREIFEDTGLLECIAIQHEYQHTLGKLIIDDDVSVDIQPRHVEKTYSRNDKIIISKMISSIKQTKNIKFKNFTKALQDDGWRIE